MNKMLQAVILAGGLATRLRPLTQTIPKSLIEINGKPFIDYQLTLLKQKGFQEIIICIGYLGEMISDYVGDGSRFNLSLKFIKDGDSLLGTAGAIKNAFHLLDDQFFVLYGDSYLNCDYFAIQQRFKESKKHGLMTVYKNNNQFDTSNVLFENGKISCYDKKNHTDNMQHIDYGLSLFNKHAFDPVPGQQNDLSAVHQHLLKKNELAVFEVAHRFYEIGSFSGIKELESLLYQPQHAT